MRLIIIPVIIIVIKSVFEWIWINESLLTASDLSQWKCCRMLESVASVELSSYCYWWKWWRREPGQRSWRRGRHRALSLSTKELCVPLCSRSSDVFLAPRGTGVFWFGSFIAGVSIGLSIPSWQSPASGTLSVFFFFRVRWAQRNCCFVTVALRLWRLTRY